VTLYGEIFASGSLGFFVAEIGVDGGIRGTIDLNLRDRQDYGPPDGKIRFGEIMENLSEGGFL
jgi:hypothetical protein